MEKCFILPDDNEVGHGIESTKKSRAFFIVNKINKTNYVNNLN